MALNKFRALFGGPARSIIAMVHVRALPGTPKSRHSVQELVDIACQEAITYQQLGIKALLLENMHDIPYTLSTGPEITATMTRVCAEVRRLMPTDVLCGVQVLACQNKEALAVAKAVGLQFIRCENFVFGHVADEGLVSGCAGDLLRYRKSIDAEDVLVFTDIKKKHSSHAITADVSLAETAKAARFFLSDGLVITGTSTGEPATMDDVLQTRSVKDIPILIGSGVTSENIGAFIKAGADGFIVGSSLKKEGAWQNEIDRTRVEQLVNSIKL